MGKIRRFEKEFNEETASNTQIDNKYKLNKNNLSKNDISSFGKL